MLRAHEVASLEQTLCDDQNPIVAHRARRLLAGDDERSPSMRALQAKIATSRAARALLQAHPEKRLHPYAKWQGPHWTLYSLAEIRHPAGKKQLIPLRDAVLDWMLAPAFQKPVRTIVFPDQPQRPRGCASLEGNQIWSQLILGIVDEERTPKLVERLLAFQWPDGGWNCDKREEARASSFQETLLPLRGLSLWAKYTGDARAAKVAGRAAEHLLSRRLLFRKRDGALVVPDWGGPIDRIHYPIRFYDVLSALLVMAEIGRVNDPRCRDALDLLETKRLADGMFPVEWSPVKTTTEIASRGTFADWGPRGKTRGNPLVTIDALYVLQRARAG